MDFYWRADDKIINNYSSLIIFPDETGSVEMENGKHYFAQEFRPVNNVLPTTQWTKGKIYKESYKIMVPLYTRPGKYTMVLSLRNGNTFATVSSGSTAFSLPNSISCATLSIQNP